MRNIYIVYLILNLLVFPFVQSDKESRDIDIYEQQLRSCMKKVSLEKDKHKKFYQQGARRLQENKPLNGVNSRSLS